MDKWFDNKNVIRVIALVIGVLLWVVVHLDEEVTPDRKMTMPVYNEKVITDVSIKRVGLDTSQYHFVSMEPETVRVTVRGPAQAVDGQFKEGTVIADLSNARAGTQTIALESAGFPEGFQVTITPLLVKVVIEEIQSKEVPVAVEVRGQPEEGFTAGTAVTTPSRVYVTAPQSQLNRIASARVSVDISGRSSALNGDYKVEAVTANGEVVQAAIQPAIVNVEVPITSPFTTVPLQLLFSGQPPAGYAVASYKMSVNEVTLYGAQDVLDPYEFYEGPTLDLSRLTSSTSYTLNIPAREGIEQVLPNTVNVEIEIVASVTRTLSALPITIIGDNEQYITRFVDLEDDRLDVTVEGAPELVGNLTAENVQLVIDVSNLPAGSHEVPLRGNLPSFIKFGANFPSTVAIEIVPRDAEETGGSIDPGEAGPVDGENVPEEEEPETDPPVDADSGQEDRSNRSGSVPPPGTDHTGTGADAVAEVSVQEAARKQAAEGAERAPERAASTFVPQRANQPEAFRR
ncbi:hypothetical protein DUZ99_03720 [Xylanibacillus composti]|uniref:CdaA regulatory protein CdaR n=1 Tax=Xylanibacillus composti TaxID=1572762 RepID=A0A8J4M3G4_9BACL|nr:CdaR family protein [Xylanibacillus composti]MDT9724108.1 hypothetical protein [Xylanibacillus composti]GIQ69501.1 CdaA regulatory protein CdaR [Xylanibacillus composti]